jgi:Leucine-rich repeat (LRR) protein
MATFITSKAIGETINIYAQTSTGFWKYNHDGVDSSINANGWVNSIPVANANGEFTIISCDVDGILNGDVTYLSLNDNQITSFDGTGLTSLTFLSLNDNQLTSFDGTGLSSLTELLLDGNLLTTLIGSTGLSNLTNLRLYRNQLTSFNSSGLSSLITLDVSENQLTSFNGTGLTNLINLYLYTNQISSFNSTDLDNLEIVHLHSNQLTSLDVSNMDKLNSLYLYSGKGAYNNPLTPSSNDAIINKFLQNAIANNFSTGFFESTGGRTSVSSSAYNALIGSQYNFEFQGNLDLVTPPPTGNGKLRVKGVTTGI